MSNIHTWIISSSACYHCPPGASTSLFFLIVINARHYSVPPRLETNQPADQPTSQQNHKLRPVPHMIQQRPDSWNLVSTQNPGPHLRQCAQDVQSCTSIVVVHPHHHMLPHALIASSGRVNFARLTRLLLQIYRHIHTYHEYALPHELKGTTRGSTIDVKNLKFLPHQVRDVNLKLAQGTRAHEHTGTRAHTRTHPMCDGLPCCLKFINKGQSGRYERNTTQACVQLPSHAELPEKVVPEVPHFRCSVPSFQGSRPPFPASTSVSLQMNIVCLTSPVPSTCK